MSSRHREVDSPSILRSRGQAILGVTATLIFVLASAGQSVTTSSPSTLDSGVSIPTTTGALGRVDAAALSEVTAHIAVVGATAWNGMQGTGTITYAQDPTSYSATFSNIGTDKFRLDTMTNTGAMSIRIDHRVGRIQNSDGTLSTIPSDTAELGLFPFEIVRRATLPGSSASLFDHGFVTVGGSPLHRITLEFPAIPSHSSTASKSTLAIDLYFDPASHLLIKSASSVMMNNSRPILFLSVVTYGDYRQVGSAMLPFRYTETLGGQQYRTLQLFSIQLNPSLASTYFEF